MYQMLVEMRTGGWKIELEALLFEEGCAIDFIESQIVKYLKILTNLEE